MLSPQEPLTNTNTNTIKLPFNNIPLPHTIISLLTTPEQYISISTNYRTLPFQFHSFITSPPHTFLSTYAHFLNKCNKPKFNFPYLNKDTFIHCITYFYIQTYITNYNTSLPPSTIKHNINYINTVVLKLYHSNILSIDHIYTLIYVLLCLCTFKVNNGVLRCSANTIIKNDVFVSLAFELLLKVNSESNNNNNSCSSSSCYVYKFLLFFYNEFIYNNYVNVFHYTTNAYCTDVFSVWNTISLIIQRDNVSKDVSDVILKILITLYKERFTQWNGMNDVVQQTKMLLINYNKNSSHDMRNVLCKNEFILKTIDTLIDKDNDLCGRDDVYKPKRCFYFNGSNNSYFTWKAVPSHSELVIIFSFNLAVNNKHQQQQQQMYSIMSITYKHNSSINIYLNKDTCSSSSSNDLYELVVHRTNSKSDRTIKTKCEIHPHRTYLTVITFTKKQTTIYYKTSTYSEYKSVSSMFHVELKKKILTFHLGKSDSSSTINTNPNINALPFKGFIGPVIGLIKSNDELIRNIFSLKGKYYDLLYIKYYDLQCVEYNKRRIITKDEANAVEYFKNKCEINIKDIIVFIVDPQAFDHVVAVNKYKGNIKNNKCECEIKANFMEFQEGTCFSGQRSVMYYTAFTQKFNVYKVYDRLFMFVDCGGFKYLVLQLEFCFQVLLVFHKAQDVVCKIVDNVNLLLQILKNMLKNVNKVAYAKEVNQVYYIMTKIINKFSDIGYDIGIFLHNIFQLITLYINIEATTNTYEDKQDVNHNLQIIRGFCDLIFNIKYYNTSSLSLTPVNADTDTNTNAKLTAIFQNIPIMFNKPYLIITPHLFYKYCKLLPFIYNTSNSSLLTSYKTLLTCFIGYSNDLLIQYTATPLPQAQDNITQYSDLLMKIILSFTIESLETTTQQQQQHTSTEHINYLLQLYFDKDVYLIRHLPFSYFTKLKDLFILLNSNLLLCITTHSHQTTYQYMLYIILHLFNRSNEHEREHEMEMYFKENNFAYSQLLFQSLLLFIITDDNKLQYDSILQLKHIQFESYDCTFIYAVFKIACVFALDNVKCIYESEIDDNDVNSIVNVYNSITKLIFHLLNSNDHACELKKQMFNNESILSLFYERHICLITKHSNAFTREFTLQVVNDFHLLTKWLFTEHSNLFLLNTMYNVIINNNHCTINEDKYSQMFFNYIELVNSITYDKAGSAKHKTFQKNIMHLLQYVYLIFTNAVTSHLIIRNKGNVITLCNFVCIVCKEQLHINKVGLVITNNNVKLIIEIIFELILTCYKLFPCDDVIATLNHVMYDNNQKENTLIHIDRLKCNNNNNNSNNCIEHPCINDVNISICFIIKLTLLLSTQDNNANTTNNNMKQCLMNMQTELINALYNINKPKIFIIHSTKNRLYKDICSIFGNNSKLSLNEVKTKIEKEIHKHTNKTGINEYDCCKLSKIAKKEYFNNNNNNKVNQPYRSVSSQNIISINDNTSSNGTYQTSIHTLQRNRLLSSDDTKDTQYRTGSDIERVVHKNENDYSITDELTLEVGEEMEMVTVNTTINDVHTKLHTMLTEILDDICKESNNKYSFNINTIHNVLRSAKKELLLSYFALQFNDVYFYNDAFVKIKSSYPYTNDTKLNTFNLLTYPSKIKNFSNTLQPPPFLKQANTFFDSTYFNISHSYITNEQTLPQQQFIPFQKHLLSQYEYQREHTFECELLNLEYCSYGSLRVYSNYIEFISSSNTKPPYMSAGDNDDSDKYIFILSGNETNNHTHNKHKHIIIYFTEITELLIKRFVYLFKAFEVFVKNGKSYFFNLLSVDDYTAFMNVLKCKGVLNADVVVVDTPDKLKAKIKEYKSQWEKGLISTYKYLLYLNKYSTRTYKDGNQYYVFPWILKDYTHIMNPYLGIDERSSTFVSNQHQPYELIVHDTTTPGINNNNNTTTCYRDMAYPISCQDDSKRKSTIKRYQELSTTESYAYHSGKHYSTSSFILYYLMRQLPFTNLMITLQNGNFESPNRMFMSFNEIQRILKSSNDNRELIPELYSSIYYMLNLNYCYFGETIYKEQVNHLQLLIDTDTNELYAPNNIGTYVQYLLMHRKLLNSPVVKKDVSKWIDYTFGCNQFIKDETCCHVFAKTSYAQLTNLSNKIKRLNAKYKDNKKLKELLLMNKVNIVLSFGQCPLQVVDSCHVINNANVNVNNKRQRHEQQDHTRIADNRKQIGSNKYIYINAISNNELIVVNDAGKVIYFNIKGTSTVSEREYNTSIPISNAYSPSVIIEQTFIIIGSIKYIISVNHIDSSIRFYNCVKKESIRFLVAEYACSICKLADNEFITGHKCGKVMHWKFNDDNNTNTNNIKMKLKRSVYAHRGEVVIIKYHSDLNVIITAGNDNCVYIRKNHDLELLCEIKVNDVNLRIRDLKYTNLNMLYVLCCDKYTTKDNVVIGFTFNGIEFARSKRGCYKNMTVTRDGNVIVNDISSKRVKILKGGELDELGGFVIKRYRNVCYEWICYANQCMYALVNNDNRNDLVWMKFESGVEEYVLFDIGSNEVFLD